MMALISEVLGAGRRRLGASSTSEAAHYVPSPAAYAVLYALQEADRAEQTGNPGVKLDSLARTLQKIGQILTEQGSDSVEPAVTDALVVLAGHFPGGEGAEHYLPPDQADTVATAISAASVTESPMITAMSRMP